ncbi:response regulator FixJ [Methylocystis parvus]|uniref:Response regulator n=1 Tax=Methylocystis parvus TaxID=134 RepID=A0A6B8M774_9HYPH|nr:response regulator FixJ [Methylocystis parvus]QGM97852.1 response regulator [Methylocystis parvus]WBK01840.1 response regulator FixJ [Methylocystis parvus OBBP]
MSEQRIVHVIDDDAAVRDAVGLLLSTEGFKVHTYPSALAFLNASLAHRDGCVVTDVRMPEMNGIELISRMKEERITNPVIVLTAHADVPLAVEAMKLGAVDLLEKPFEDAALLAAVDMALERRNAEETRSRESAAIKNRLASLTRRENEILAGLLKGLSNKVIAHDLGISIRTAEVHRANIMAKMRAGNLAELVKMALAAGGSSGESE